MEVSESWLRSAEAPVAAPRQHVQILPRRVNGHGASRSSRLMIQSNTARLDHLARYSRNLASRERVILVDGYWSRNITVSFALILQVCFFPLFFPLKNGLIVRVAKLCRKPVRFWISLNLDHLTGWLLQSSCLHLSWSWCRFLGKFVTRGVFCS